MTSRSAIFRRSTRSISKHDAAFNRRVSVTQLINHDDPRIAQGHARFDHYWSSIGASDPDLIAYLVNPMFQGKPAWPNTRQAYRVVRPPGSLIIASDGLCDPFVGTDIVNKQGFGCEVYIEAPEFSGADFDTLRGSWAFRVIENFAMNVAEWGRAIAADCTTWGHFDRVRHARRIARYRAVGGRFGRLFGQPRAIWPPRPDRRHAVRPRRHRRPDTPNTARTRSASHRGCCGRQSLAAARSKAGGHVSRLP
jgi:hypothetical protein